MVVSPMDDADFLPLGPVFDPQCPPDEAAEAFYKRMTLRRSVRKFSSRPVAKETVEWIVKAATTAPSGANKQPWRFVAISDPNLKRKIREAAEEEEHAFYQHRAPDTWIEDLAPLGTHAEKPYLETAPWLLAVFRCSQDEEGGKTYYSQESVGIAVGFLLCAAHHAGLCTLTHTPSPMKFLQTILQRPPTEKAYMLIPLGYPAEDCLVPKLAMQRKPLSQVLHFHSTLLLLLLFFAAWFSSVPQEPATTTPDAHPHYRILVANDDGIQSPGLAALTQALQSLGDVVVCAPPQNRSGSSHSSTMYSAPMAIQKSQLPGATEVWVVDGSPSDCVTFGLLHLGAEQPFDLVVSGINRGHNAGYIAEYSGTVGAAMEGAMYGVVSVAVSQRVSPGNTPNYQFAANFTARLAHRLLLEKAPADVVYSVNIPFDRAEETKNVVIAPMGGAYLQVTGFEILPGEQQTFARTLARYNQDVPAGSDTAWLQSGCITITPLRLDWTDQTMLKRMQGWNLQLDTSTKESAHPPK